MKKMPVGIQSFRKILEDDCIYIDKTQHIYNLIHGASNYFLSRPRRFGKSLLLDTIGEAFSGDKELFKGLWIYDSDFDFKKHPVIKIDLSRIATETPEIFKESLLSDIIRLYLQESIEIKDKTPSDAFITLINELYKKYNERVVVLIDEYDKPILDNMNDVEVAEANREVLRRFYGVLKPMDPYLRFVFITGVSRFTKTSIFSELNNLTDITLADKYADICGIPVESLEQHFSEHIKHLSTLDNFRHYDSISDVILRWYDGYSWDGKRKMLNPFSLLCLFELKQIESFWYTSGSPKFFIEIIKNKPESFMKLKNMEISSRVLETFDINKMELEPLLFQTGYLTVKEVIFQDGPSVYRLDIPNLEVREAFTMQLLSELTESGETLADISYRGMKDALQLGELTKMLELLRSLFASIPYELHVKAEAYYHSIFYVVMTLLGFDMDVEVSTSRGRIDAVLELDDKVYVIELKYEDCPRDASNETKRGLFDKALMEAMEQINNKGYADKFQSSGKEIYKAAFAFLGRDEIEMLVE
ncbi:MAG: ATP-binding protein [Oscillospiraceae bacterium]|nr:ATP-binding protein [Oscillospiraceae bacterium]